MRWELFAVRAFSFAIPGALFGDGVGFPWWGFMMAGALSGVLGALLLLHDSWQAWWTASAGLVVLFFVYVLAGGSWPVLGLLELISCAALIVLLLWGHREIEAAKAQEARDRENPNIRFASPRS